MSGSPKTQELLPEAGPEDRGDAHAAVRLQVVLQDRRKNARNREPGTVDRVHEFRPPALSGTKTDLRPPRLDTLCALATFDSDAVFPRHRGRNGHPIVVRARLLEPYRGAVDPPPLKETLAAVRVAVDVHDPAVLGDFDRPDDLPGSPSGEA